MRFFKLSFMIIFLSVLGSVFYCLIFLYRYTGEDALCCSNECCRLTKLMWLKAPLSDVEVANIVWKTLGRMEVDDTRHRAICGWSHMCVYGLSCAVVLWLRQSSPRRKPTRPIQVWSMMIGAYRRWMLVMTMMIWCDGVDDDNDEWWPRLR